MVDGRLARFLDRYRESAAYHEAGHIIAAAVQEMPLQEWGIHVDPEGSGISYYWDRKPGDFANSERDTLERERTIVAIYAGWVAQRTFFPDCGGEGWGSDEKKVQALLDEMQLPDRKTTIGILWGRASELVAQRWSVIKALAKALLAKPCTLQPAREVTENWSGGKTSLEKFMTGPEVLDLLQEFQIRARVCVDSAGRHDVG